MAVSTQDIGKQAELFVFGELISRGAELYIPLVDRGVDAIVRGEDGSYFELQVKGKKAEGSAKYFDFYWEPDFDRKPRENRFFVCVNLNEDPPKVWVLPWGIFKEYARGAGAMRRLALPEKRRGDNKTREELLLEFCSIKDDNPNNAAWKPLLPPPTTT